MRGLVLAQRALLHGPYDLAQGLARTSDRQQLEQPAAGAGQVELAKDPQLHAELQVAVDEANATVSHAEAIKKFRILPADFSEETGEMTPTLKVKRNVVAKKYTDDIVRCTTNIWADKITKVVR